MTTKKDFIKNLLEKTKDTRDGILTPNEVELKLSDIDNFNLIIANELAGIEEVIFIKGNPNKNKQEYKAKLLQYSLENDSIRFCPIALKNYLIKINL